MNVNQIERAVARQTGESRRTVARYGFQLEQPPNNPDCGPCNGGPCLRCKPGI